MGRTITGTTRGCKLTSGIQDAGNVIAQLRLPDAEGVVTPGVKEHGY